MMRYIIWMAKNRFHLHYKEALKAIKRNYELRAERKRHLYKQTFRADVRSIITEKPLFIELYLERALPTKTYPLERFADFVDLFEKVPGEKL